MRLQHVQTTHCKNKHRSDITLSLSLSVLHSVKLDRFLYLVDKMAFDLHSVFLAKIAKHFHISYNYMRYRGTAVNFTLQMEKYEI